MIYQIIGSIISGANKQYGLSEDLNTIMKSNPEATFDFFNPAITIVVLLIAVAFFLALGFFLLGFITDFKGSIKFIGGILAAGILFAILYSTSDAETTGRVAELAEKFKVSGNVSKLISGGVKTAVISILVAFGAAVVMEVLNLFK